MIALRCIVLVLLVGCGGEVGTTCPKSCAPALAECQASDAGADACELDRLHCEELRLSCHAQP